MIPPPLSRFQLFRRGLAPAALGAIVMLTTSMLDGVGQFSVANAGRS
jgi:hypothetical protein